MSTTGPASRDPKRPDTIGSPGTTPIRRISVQDLPPVRHNPPPAVKRHRQTRGSQAAAAPTSDKQPGLPIKLRPFRLPLGAAGLATLLVVFIYMGRSDPVEIKLAPPSDAPLSADAPGTSEESPLIAESPEQWVALARISAVRKSKLIVNGSIYGLNETIPPFNLHWAGKRESELIFHDSTGTEYRRRYATSLNSDPSAPSPEAENPPRAP